MRRLPYHQSLFDLLDAELPESPEARELIEACERRCGRRLPEAVRQWYLLRDVVPLTLEQLRQGQRHFLWMPYQDYLPEPLTSVLQQFAGDLDRWEPVSEQCGPVAPESGAPCIQVFQNLLQGCESGTWFLQLDGSDDPPVVFPENPESRKAIHFSRFVFDWIARFYGLATAPFLARTPAGIVCDWSGYDAEINRRPHPRNQAEMCEKRFSNGLWLCAPNDEPLDPPDLGYLLESLAGGRRLRLSERVTRYEFTSEDSRLRVTTDDFGTPGGASAWWLHATSVEGLSQLARCVLVCGRLQATLRVGTEITLPIIERLRHWNLV